MRYTTLNFSSTMRHTVATALIAPVALIASTAPIASAASANIATTGEKTPKAEFDNALLEFTTFEDDGSPSFDTEGAKKAGASDYLLDAGEALNSLFDDSASDDKSLNPATWPRWGNWCGKGHSGPGAPTDAVDEACMYHDKCYAEKGYDNCSCDRQLAAEADQARKTPGLSAAAKTAGRIISFWASHKQCH